MLFFRVIESLFPSSFTVDRDGQFQHHGKAISEEDLKGKHFDEVVEVFQPTQKNFSHLAQLAEHRPIQVTIKCIKTGTILDGLMFYISEESAFCFLLVKMASEYERSLSRLKLLEETIQNLPLALFCQETAQKTGKKRYVIWNKKSEELFALKAEDVLGKTSLGDINEKLNQSFELMDKQVLEQKKVIKVTDLNVEVQKSGRRVLHLIKAPLGKKEKVKYIVGVAEDITESKRLSQKLKLSESVDQLIIASHPIKKFKTEFLKLICHHIGYSYGGFWKLDIKKGILNLDQLYISKEVNQERFKDFILAAKDHHPVAGEGLVGYVWKTLTPYWTNDITNSAQYHRANVSKICGLHGAIAFPVYDEERFYGVVEFFSEEVGHPDDNFLFGFREICFRVANYFSKRLLERALGKKTLFYVNMIKNLAGIVYRCALDKDWTMEFLSPGTELITGYHPSEFVNNQVRSFASIIHPEDREMASKIVMDAVQARMSFVIDYRILHKNGEVRWVHEQGQATYGPTGEPLFLDGVILDFTEVKKLRDELEGEREKSIVNSKLAAQGEMAGGVAHEINNPLVIMSGEILLMRRELSASGVDRNMIETRLEKLENTISRISKITRSLLNLSRSSESNSYESCTLDSIVRDTLDLCEQKFKNHNIKLSFKASNALMLNCQRVQVGQVILNLLNNAFDAVSGLNEKWIDIEISSEGEFVVLTVTDSGKGIPDSVKGKIMCPFFTTKAMGKGTGLGLSISKTIVESHCGSIVLDENCPHTRFVVKFHKDPIRLKNVA